MHIIIVISPESTAKCDISGFLESVRPLSNPVKPGYCGQLAIMFQGYDGDDRSLYEIPEVRAWVQAADAAWPCIGYFGTTLPGAETLQLFGFSNIDITAYRDHKQKRVGVAYDIPTFLKGTPTDSPGWLMKRMLMMNHIAEEAYGPDVLDQHGNPTPLMEERERLIHNRTCEMFAAFNLAQHSGLTPIPQ